MCVCAGEGVFGEKWFEVRWDYPQWEIPLSTERTWFSEDPFNCMSWKHSSKIFWELQIHISFYRWSLPRGRSPVPVVCNCPWRPWNLEEFGRHPGDARWVEHESRRGRRRTAKPMTLGSSDNYWGNKGGLSSASEAVGCGAREFRVMFPWCLKCFPAPRRNCTGIG